MPISFGTQFEKMPIDKLILEKDRWQKNRLEDGLKSYCDKVLARIDASIARKSNLTQLGQLLDTEYINVYDKTGACRVHYPVASDVREDCACVYLIGNDGRIDSMQTMHVSKVEQYVIDHGFDPNGTWSS